MNEVNSLLQTESPDSSYQYDKQDNVSILKRDVKHMLKFAINTGKALPESISLDEESDYSQLLSDYNALVKVVTPATPESIIYLNTELSKIGSDSKWYQIPIFTKCTIIAIAALLILIGVSMHPLVDETHQNSGLLESSGLILLINVIFICAASLLGVMFFLLKTMSEKIRNSTLLPHDSVELNADIVIGIISGFVITELFTIDSGSIDTSFLVVQKMTLALLGGFSSDAIFSTLKGIVAKVKNIFI